GFQEVSGIWARLGEKTASLLGNANLTIAMRQQDSGRTREWIEQTAGRTYITQATSYQGAGDGAYREARHAEVRPVSRIDWNDLTSLIEGEAIVLFGGRRIYARVFHARIDDAGYKRLGRTVMLPLPDADEVRERLRRAGTLASLIERGALTIGADEGVPPALAALIEGFAKAARPGAAGADCACSALVALSDVPEDRLPPRPPPPADGSPVTVVSPMLASASEAPIAGPDPEGQPVEPIDVTLVRRLIAIEAAAGLAAPAARAAAMLGVAERDAGLSRGVEIDPPPMSAEAFTAALRALLTELQELRARLARRQAT
ncbi:MAG TPA: conjugal transfer protein TraG, partial [Acetobacteraceae bacterium]|nr:conjugal transfer protein TraG [Acetobacteraceae bacterium]